MKTVKKHINIPVFIPHYGCKYDCIFCNQKKITGKTSYNRGQVCEEIERAAKTIDYANSEVELAFFGGSFTAIDREEMLSLLDIANRYREIGIIEKIRLSTRPDAIDGEILTILKRYNVTTIELGIQSFSDNVLKLCERGHTAQESALACKMIKLFGFELVGQMMCGLPGSSFDDEIYTAREIVRLGADGARIYPTVVFPDTKLERMTQSGEYEPLSVEEATLRGVRVFSVFAENGVTVIRIGLCANETLVQNGGNLYHSAMGELILNGFYLDKMRNLLDREKNTEGKTAFFTLEKGKVSQAVGQRRKNVEILKKEYLLGDIKFKESEDMTGYGIALNLR